MDNQQKSSWPNPVPPLGAGEGESPLVKAAPQPIDMRTMSSDTKSVSESGGSPMPKPYTPPTPTVQQTPRPYIPPPPVRPAAPPMPPIPPTPPPDMSAGFPPQQRTVPPPPQSSAFPPQKPSVPPVPPRDVFKPPQVETMKSTPISPSGPITPITPGATQNMPQKRSGKGVLIGVSVGVIVLGAAAYFVYPMLLSQPQIEPAPQTPESNEIIPEEPAETTPPAVEETPVVPPPTYTSLLKTPASQTANADVTPVSLTTWKALFGTATSETPIFKEIIVRNGEENLAFGALTGVLFPGAFTDEFVNSFSKDVTVFLYTDASGVWPGFIAKQDSASTIALSALQNSFKSSLEALSPNLISSLYVTDPGTPQTWKQGQTGDVANRYLIFSTSDSAISTNYGWLGNTLIMSASYDGFKEALKYLR